MMKSRRECNEGADRKDEDGAAKLGTDVPLSPADSSRRGKSTRGAPLSALPCSPEPLVRATLYCQRPLVANLNSF